MEERTQQAIERMAVFFEDSGLPRIAGRVLGYLLLSPEPRSLDDLAEALQVSKSSASTDARLLERLGTAERVTVPGDRRDYYRIAPELAHRMAGIWLEQLVGTRTLLAEALDTGAAESRVVSDRLRRGIRYLEALAEAVERAGAVLVEEGRT